MQANEAAKQDRNVIIEPINTRDVPGYFLNRQADAHQVVESVGLPNLRKDVQMDLWPSCADRRRRRRDEGSQIHR